MVNPLFHLCCRCGLLQNIGVCSQGVCRALLFFSFVYFVSLRFRSCSFRSVPFRIRFLSFLSLSFRLCSVLFSFVSVAVSVCFVSFIFVSNFVFALLFTFRDPGSLDSNEPAADPWERRQLQQAFPHLSRACVPAGPKSTVSVNWDSLSHDECRYHLYCCRKFTR